MFSVTVRSKIVPVRPNFGTRIFNQIGGRLCQIDPLREARLKSQFLTFPFAS